jgi:NAD+ kinase
MASQARQSIAIIYRSNTPNAVRLARELHTHFSKLNVRVFVGPDQSPIRGIKTCHRTTYKKCSLIVALGGDGTYLRAARLLGDALVPILGINLGSLGFLTPTRAEDMITAATKALDHKMCLRSRSALTVELKGSGKGSKKFKSLNDVVVERADLSQLITLAISCDGEAVSQVKSDGLIVSTPTGSTAYNLAAGGPIMHPEVRAVVVTAIAPHSLTNRPMLIPDHQKISLQLLGKKQRAQLVIDGQKVADLNPDDRVFISRNKVNHIMVEDPQFSYFQLLKEKLKFGER